MHAEIAEAWAKRLEENPDIQAQGKLRRGDKFCCLGVLVDMAIEAGVGVEWDGNTAVDSCSGLLHGGTLPNVVERWAGMRSDIGWYGESTLSHLNDTGTLFPEMAETIRALAYRL